jgi:sterol desaturase/sphingolipid hydroxylase (fatty acid hydroxylase superfamily)
MLNNLPVPAWTVVVVSVLLLDVAIYLQHVMFHAVPALWRVHRMHHADLEFDVTTGARFHPIEIVLSMLIKLGVVAALGASALGVLIFEVLLNATSMFNHGNASHPRTARSISSMVRRHARHATACTIRLWLAKPTATSASTYRGGTGYWEPTAVSPPPVMRV